VTVLRAADIEGPMITSITEEPERPRDFEIEGSYAVLFRELREDQKENDCRSYLVFQDKSVWYVWRVP